MGIEIFQLSGTGLDELTEAWNRCWQGYYYDMRFAPANMKLWLELGQVDLNCSLALFHSGKVIGFSLLSKSESEGWIAGTSIEPFYRGRKLFAPLMQAQLDLARKSGFQCIYLEVLEQNFAYRVYKAVGFQEIRRLKVYRAKETQTSFWRELERIYIPGFFRAGSLDDYFAVRADYAFHPPWQRRENYLRRYGNLKALVNRQGTAGILMAGEQETIVDAWCSSAQEAGRVLAEIAHRNKGKINLTNQPEDWLAAYMTTAKLKPEAIQIEMRALLG